jgi:formylglycine-generating enzyme required for sulfatase activity
MRGGSWGNVVTGLNAADRGNNTRVYRDNILGFRVARSLNP